LDVKNSKHILIQFFSLENYFDEIWVPRMYMQEAFV
jgi:hypothetical protein